MEHDNRPKSDRKDKERLDKTVEKVNKLVSTFAKIIIIECSHVGSFQLQKIRKTLRGEAEIVRGKVVRNISSLISDSEDPIFFLNIKFILMLPLLFKII
jgi:ribosomal protein L10